MDRPGGTSRDPDREAALARSFAQALRREGSVLLTWEKQAIANLLDGLSRRPTQPAAPTSVREPRPELGRHGPRMLTLMSFAESASALSTCAKLKVGAAIGTPDLRHVAVGYNGSYAGGPNGCAGGDACDCFHAEDNVLQRAPDREGLWLAVTVTPCPTCARRIINSRRVARVIVGREYKDRGSARLLTGHGIEYRTLS